MSHCFDLIPLRDNRPLDCWLDTPVERVVIGCTCGWIGPGLALDADGLAAFAGEMSLTETDFVRAVAIWEARHADVLVPAAASLAVSNLTPA